MPSDARLVPTQQWLQDHIVSPTLDEETADRESEKLIKPSSTLSARERADVYRSMYLLVMEEALTSDYPVLRDYMGQEAFSALVAEYVQVHPSTSYTLNRLGDHLPGFLATRDALQHAVARFELAVTEVFDAEQSDVLTASEIMAIPPDQYADIVLSPIPALRMVQLDFPAQRFKEAYRDDEPYPESSSEASQLVVYRRDYQVFWIEMDRAAFELFGSLATGEALGAAIESACLSGGANETQLFGWFQEWVSNGLFQSVQVNPDVD